MGASESGQARMESSLMSIRNRRYPERAALAVTGRVDSGGLRRIVQYKYKTVQN
jgi:hypothetical protein